MQKVAKEYYIITIIIDVILLPVVESIIPVYSHHMSDYFDYRFQENDNLAGSNSNERYIYSCTLWY